MIDWTTFPIRDGLTGLALIVSSLSLYISWSTARRAKAEKAVNAWITLTRPGTEWWLATLNVKNGSHLGIEIEKLAVDLPDYRLGDLAQAKQITAPDGTPPGIDMAGVDHCLAMPFKFTVAAGETLQREFLLHQPAHSSRKSTKVSVMYWTLEPKRRWRILPVIVQTEANYEIRLVAEIDEPVPLLKCRQLNTLGRRQLYYEAPEGRAYAGGMATEAA
jgi:hypothetical protein